MATERINPQKPRRPRPAPATTPEDRERQLQALAYDVAEKQLREGNASAQLISQLVRSASSRERLDHQKIMKEVDLLEKKAASMESAARMEQKYDEAIRAMRAYGGHDDEDE